MSLVKLLKHKYSHQSEENRVNKCHFSLNRINYFQQRTLSILRSRIENVPSSLPDANIQLASLIKKTTKVTKLLSVQNSLIEPVSYDTNLFHEITLTSVLCALIEAAGDFPKRVSHIAIVVSTELEANTNGSVGLHCIEKKF